MSANSRSGQHTRALPQLAMAGLVVVLGAGPADSQDWTRLRERARPSMVYLEVTQVGRRDDDRRTRTGSGFIVTDQGHVLTVAHLFSDRESEYSFEVRGSVESRFAGTRPLDLVARNDSLDLAVLRFRDTAEWAFLPIYGDISTLLEDSRLYALGFPMTFELSSAEGLLSSLAGLNGKWQTTIPLNVGNSGGPVFDSEGEVVAVVAGGITDAQGITYVIPVAYARELLASLPNLRPARPMPPSNFRIIGATVLKRIPFMLSVGENTKRQFNHKICIQPGQTVKAVAAIINGVEGSETRLESVSPLKNDSSCVILRAFVGGTRLNEPTFYPRAEVDGSAIAGYVEIDAIVE